MDARLSPLRILVALALLLIPMLAFADDGDAQVEEVGVQLDLAGGYVGGETMSQLEQALLQVAKVALIDQLDGSLAYIVNNKQEVEDSLSTVISSVLAKRGFTLEGLTLAPGVQTSLTVRLSLMQERVESFDVKFMLLGNTPVIDAVVDEDEEAISAALYTTVARTPYGDQRWLSGLVTDTVEQHLADMPAYRDFDHLVLVLPGPKTKVAVTFTPREDAQVISDYKLRTRSGTLLNVTLEPVRDEATYYMHSLVGAPSSFLDAKMDALREALFQYLVNCGALSGLCATATMQLRVEGCTLNSTINVESEQYVLGVQGRVDLWEHGDGRRNARLSLRGGMQPSPGWAVYTQWDYYPGSSEVFPVLGGARLLHNGFIGAGWDFKADTWRAQVEQDLSPDVYVSANLYSHSNHVDENALSELGLHYRLADAYELQLLSNFNGEVYAALAANL